MQYTKENLNDLKNVVNIDDIGIGFLNFDNYFNYKDIKTVCSKKRASKNHKRYVYIGCGFDTETTRVPDNNISFVYIWQFSIGNKTFISRHIETLKDFIVLLSYWVEKRFKKATLLVYGANIAYDFQFIKMYLKDIISDAFAKSQREIISYTLLKNIKIMECLGVWGTSLEKCAKDYTTRKKLKGDLDYNTFRTPTTKLTQKELLYCIHDVLICGELVIKAFDTYTKHGLKIPFTQTGIIRNELKNSFTRIEKKITIDSLASYYENQKRYNIHRQFLYSGGWCHSNVTYVGKVIDNVISYDIESSYPSQMAKNFPAGQIIQSDFINCAKHKHWIACVELIDICARYDHTLISSHKIVEVMQDNNKIKLADSVVYDNGRVFSARKIVIYMNEIDFENIKKLYVFKMKVIKSWFFTRSCKMPKQVNDLMIKYYKLKTILKHNGFSNTLEYKISKSKLNSIYGMLCTQIYCTEMSYNPETGTFTTINKQWEKCNKSLLNCYSGYWVSAYARQQLVDIVANFPEQIIQYDTDSIYAIKSEELEKYVSDFNNKKRAFNLTRFNNDTNMINLGIWDNNGEYKQFCGYGAKRYAGISTKDNNIHITWAGGRQNDILMAYRTQNKKDKTNTSIFDYLSCISVDTLFSTKKASKYIDEPQTIVIDGKQTKILSCVVLDIASFKCILSNQFNELKQKTDGLRNKYIFGDGKNDRI